MFPRQICRIQNGNLWSKSIFSRVCDVDCEDHFVGRNYQSAICWRQSVLKDILSLNMRLQNHIYESISMISMKLSLYRLRPSTPAQLCWSSSRLQPLQKLQPIKFALIRPSTLNHDRNLWNVRGAPDETTCFAVFFRCPSALILFLHEIV